MREILFKAKRKDNEEWVFGNYVHTDCYMECNDYIGQNKPMEHMIDQDTLCQYAGLIDGNGRKIFENDIVRWQDISGKYYHAVIKFGRYGNMDYGFYLKWIEDIGMRPNLAYWFDKLEVAGNLFDNPNIWEEKL